MKIEKLSETSDKLQFIKDFASLNNTLNQDYNRPMSSPESVAHLLNVFSHVPKELILIHDGENYVGRVCANTTKADDDYILFGLIEYERTNAEILKLLMNEVEAYAKSVERKNIIGPVDINVWFGNRFKSKGYDNNRHWEPNSPKEYLDHMLDLDYKLDQDYLSCFYSSLMPCYERTKTAYDKVISEGYTFRNLAPSTEEEIDKLYTLNTGGFSKNYFYESITREEYKNTHILALKGFDFQYSFFILDQSGNELGYVFSYPDTDNRIIIKSLVMDPAARGARLSSALVHASIKQALENGIVLACGACVRKGNISEHFFDHLGEKEMVHEYTLVSKSL